jgi:hypothetical protein
VPLFACSAAETLAAAFGNPLSNDAFVFNWVRALHATGGLVPWRGSWSLSRYVWPALVARGTDGSWTGFAPNAGLLLRLTGPSSALPLVAAVAALFAWAGRPLRAGPGIGAATSAPPDAGKEGAA